MEVIIFRLGNSFLGGLTASETNRTNPTNKCAYIIKSGLPINKFPVNHPALFILSQTKTNVKHYCLTSKYS